MVTSRPAVKTSGVSSRHLSLTYPCIRSASLLTARISPAERIAGAMRLSTAARSSGTVAHMWISTPTSAFATSPAAGNWEPWTISMTFASAKRTSRVGQSGSIVPHCSQGDPSISPENRVVRPTTWASLVINVGTVPPYSSIGVPHVAQTGTSIPVDSPEVSDTVRLLVPPRGAGRHSDSIPGAEHLSTAGRTTDSGSVVAVALEMRPGAKCDQAPRGSCTCPSRSRDPLDLAGPLSMPSSSGLPSASQEGGLAS